MTIIAERNEEFENFTDASLKNNIRVMKIYMERNSDQETKDWYRDRIEKMEVEVNRREELKNGIITA